MEVLYSSYIRRFNFYALRLTNILLLAFDSDWVCLPFPISSSIYRRQREFLPSKSAFGALQMRGDKPIVLSKISVLTFVKYTSWIAPCINVGLRPNLWTSLIFCQKINRNEHPINSHWLSFDNIPTISQSYSSNETNKTITAGLPFTIQDG